MSGRAGAPSRDQAAFQWLLSREDEDEDGRRQQGGRRRSGGQQGRRRSSGREGRPFIPGFQLREEAKGRGAATAARGSGGAAAGPPALAALQEAFAGLLPPEVVADVLAACGGDSAAASEALLGMTGGGAGGDEAPAMAAAAATAAAEHAPPAVPGAGGPCYLHLLPEEIKQLIFDQLSLRDLARAARASREFASYVREQRRKLRMVVVPEGVSYTAVRSLVTAFGNASGVSLTRCAHQLRFQHEFEDMLQAVALGEADRSSGVPVSQVVLARCGQAGDAVLSTLCDTFAQLRRLDLSRCTEVTDAGVARLAAYTRQPAAASSGSDAADGDEEEGLGEEEAVAAAVGGLQLAAGAAGAADAAGTKVPAMESPDSAVKRLAAQRHAAMMTSSAAAARAQHRRPLAGGLEELSLKETSVGSRGTKLLLQPGSATSKSLKALDVSRCPNLGGDGLDVHPRAVLEVLRASGCNALRSVVIQLPPEAPLRTLQLDSCRQLHELVLVAHRLESLNVSHCGQLRTVALRCRCAPHGLSRWWALRCLRRQQLPTRSRSPPLRVHHHKSVGPPPASPPPLHSRPINYRRLRELRAVNCGSLNLAASELHCPALEEVNLFGARQLDAEGLEAAAPSLVKCRRLDLTGCTSLSRLLLPDAAALQSVSVSGCGVLRQVLLASPALRELRAAACSRLVDLRLGAASLAVLDLENCEHLREVQLSGAGRPPQAASPADNPQQGERDGPKALLVLRGCTSLPAEVRQRLRAAVLGA
ncbi:hypothetical protein ABPG77_008427 [Micractinium sp. CCAP 211/92]